MTHIHLQLEAEGSTLVAQRGEWAVLRPLLDCSSLSLAQAIEEALNELALIEADPPAISTLSEPPKPSTDKGGKATKRPRSAPTPAGEVDEETEPTLDIPTRTHKRGFLSVPLSYLKIVAGETDAAAYRQAMLIAGRLLDGKLWDGTCPLRLRDVYAIQRQIKALSDKDFSLFQLSDFAEV